MKTLKSRFTSLWLCLACQHRISCCSMKYNSSDISLLWLALPTVGARSQSRMGWLQGHVWEMEAPDITCYQTIDIQWYAPSVCAVFYVFWHLKTAELPMIWKDQSATFSTKIAWSSSAIDHVQSPGDWHKNRTGARHLLSVHTRSHHSLVQGFFYAAR